MCLLSDGRVGCFVLAARSPPRLLVDATAARCPLLSRGPGRPEVCCAAVQRRDQTALYEVCEDGGEQDRIWKDDLVDALKTRLGGGIKWERHTGTEKTGSQVQARTPCKGAA
jgi:hypothetical protein